MHIVKHKTVHLLILIGILVGLSACNHDRNHPGYAYMPDMYYSESYNAYSENPVFRDSVTNQLPPKGTIARNHMPYPFQPKNYFDQIQAGKDLINPIKINETSLAEGKAQYEIFCISCHGVSGDGNGHLYTSKKYPMKPTSLIESYVQSKADGEIYHIVTVGSLSGLMGAHGTQIKSDNRWKIINYIREELAKK